MTNSDNTVPIETIENIQKNRGADSVIERVAVTSSLLREVGYNPQTQILEVQFMREPNDVYRYFGVEASTHQAMMSATSVGVYFVANIKKGPFRYEKLT